MTRRSSWWRRATVGLCLGAAAGGCRSSGPTVPLTNAPRGTPGAVNAIPPLFGFSGEQRGSPPPSVALSPPPLRGRVRVGGETPTASDIVSATGSATPHPNPPPQGGREPESQVQQAAALEPAPAVPAPPTVPAAADLPIDLGSALTLAGVDNPTIGLARELVNEAVARQLAARVLLLPDLNVGANVHVHRGNLQRAPGQVFDVNSQNWYAGLGANALAANPAAIPGVWLLGHLGDAAYEPLVARQQVAVRTSDARAVNNTVLLDVTAAYLELVGAEARAASLRLSETDLAEVTRLTTAYAKTGQGRAGDANRATADADLLRLQVQQADEDTVVAAVRLARLLNLDPSARLKTPGGPISPVRLIDEAQDLEPLVQLALRGRPEVAARTAAVGEAQFRVKQEKVRPWLPTVSAGFSAGQFGGGSNRVGYAQSAGASRTDFDVAAFWTTQNLGVGNHARVRAAAGVLGQAVADLERVKNRVRDEVAEAKAAAQAAAEQVRVATAAVGIAEEGYRLEMERIKEAQGLPLEVLDSFKQLAAARLDVIRAAVAYNVAQFRLFVALGNPPPNP